MSFVARLILLAAAVTALRLAVLAGSPTDLFFDEAQYWLWGQSLDFGYYSKPPLIAWLIRLVIELAGSIDPFWVRFPAPLLHAATAVILGLWAEGIRRNAGLWVAAVYLSMPIVGVGSWMMSTDTVMAPLLAGGLWAWFRHLETHKSGHAAVAGLLVGLAMMAKYAAIYFWIGAALAASFSGSRPTTRGVWSAIGFFGLIIAPNAIWNLFNDLATLEHTMDNADWVREGQSGALNWVGLGSFVAGQFAVMGPVFFAAFLWAAVRPNGLGRFLCFALPVLALVCVQALLSKAYANWAFAAYLPAVPFTVLWLLEKGLRRWMWIGLAVNMLISAVLVLLILVPDLAPGATARYMGRAALADRIFAAAGDRVVLATHRHLLADLFYARDAQGVEVELFALRPVGRPMHYYEQTYPWNGAGKGFFVGFEPPVCGGVAVKPDVVFEMEHGAYAGSQVKGYVLPDGCEPSRQ